MPQEPKPWERKWEPPPMPKGGTKPWERFGKSEGAPSDAPKSTPVADFLDGALSQLNPITAVKGLSEAAMHPIETGKALLQNQGEAGERMVSDFREGRIGEGVRHGIGWLLPVIGPEINRMGDAAGRGDVARSLGEATGMGVSLGLPFALKSVRPPAVVKNVNTPVEEAAISSLEPDVPLSLGQRTGSRAIKRVEQGLENVPGSSSRVQEFFSTQEQALSDKGRTLARATAPVQTNEYGAGQAMLDRGAQRISRLKGFADRAYDDVRTELAKNVKQVQTGTRTSPIVTPQGQPIVTPVMSAIESPVQLAPMRARLQPIYDDLTRLMPEARRQASPAYRALQDLMTSGDEVMSAADFDKSLGAIKALAREGESPFLTSKSQGIAREVIQAGESELARSMPQAVRSRLQSARNAVKAYYETAELMEELGDEPGRVYGTLITGGDRALNLLRDLNRIAPNEVRITARTFLEGLVDKASREGGFNRAAGIYADWNRMGPETKRLLFGSRTDDINNFLLGAKKVTQDVNPSGTAKMHAALGAAGAAGTVAGAIVTGHPEYAALVAAGVPASRALAEVLLRPGAYNALLGKGSINTSTPLAIGAAGRAGYGRGGYDPLRDLTDQQRAFVQRDLQDTGRAEITIDGHKRMWTTEEGGRIRRLR